MTNDEMRERCKLFRKYHEISKRQMAALLNTPARTYKAWEEGRYRYPGAVRLALAYLEYKLGTCAGLEPIAVSRGAFADHYALSEELKYCC